LSLDKENNISQKLKLQSYFNEFSDKTLLIDVHGREISYETIFNDSLKLIHFFKKEGLKKNSKILILSNNCVNYLIVLIACLFGGYMVCPVDPNMKTERLRELKKILNIDYVINDANKLEFDNFQPDSSVINYENNDFLIIYSSGTTGDPKGILFSSDSFLKSAQSFSGLAGYDEQTKIFHCLPMFYMAGILNTFFACLFSGSTAVVGEKASISNILNFWELPKKFNVNSLHLTPSIVGSICEMYRPNLEINKHVHEYKSIISTGSYLYPEIQEKFYKIFNKRVLSCYGVTELGGPLTIQSWEDTFDDHCVGSHTNEVSVKIKSDKDNINLITINSPFIMKGYLGKNGLEKPVLDNGFYNTEDIGEYKNGLLFISGRTRDIIKKGGELISLSYIESVTLKLEGVLEAAAVGKKNLLSGEDLYLFVTIKGKFKLEEKILEIRKFLGKKIRPIELPNKIIITSQIPKTSNGKIKKNDLIDLHTV